MGTISQSLLGAIQVKKKENGHNHYETHQKQRRKTKTSHTNNFSNPMLHASFSHTLLQTLYKLKNKISNAIKLLQIPVYKLRFFVCFF